MAIEIVDFPIKNCGSFHCYVSSPEGIQERFLVVKIRGMGLLGEIEQFPGGSQLQSLRSSPSQGASRIDGDGSRSKFSPFGFNHFGPCNEPEAMLRNRPFL